MLGICMDISSLFQDFNPAKFLVYSSLCAVIYFLSLQLDHYINWSIWLILSPLWIWKSFVIAGTFFGSLVWWKSNETSTESYIQYKAMLLSFALQMLVLIFELLLCDKLSRNRYQWSQVFVPLIFASILSFPVTVWCIKNDLTYDLEIFLSANVFQFILLPLKLDKIIDWSWLLIFVPLWLISCVSIFYLITTAFLAITMIRFPSIMFIRGRNNIYASVTYSLLVVPFLIFQVLLISRLENKTPIHFTIIMLPLLVSLFLLISLSFNCKPQNPWWFGFKKDFCSYFLEMCPLLQEYGNISYYRDYSPRNPTRSSISSAIPTSTVTPQSVEFRYSSAKLKTHGSNGASKASAKLSVPPSPHHV